MTETVALYLTRAGKEGARVVRYVSPDGAEGFRWSGAWGAGCGPRADLVATVQRIAARKGGKGWALPLPYQSGNGLSDRPLAASGLTSYRARGRYGWIMIGARDTADAWREARRSSDAPTDLQIWDAAAACYVSVAP